MYHVLIIHAFAHHCSDPGKQSTADIFKSIYVLSLLLKIESRLYTNFPSLTFTSVWHAYHALAYLLLSPENTSLVSASVSDISNTWLLYMLRLNKLVSIL